VQSQIGLYTRNVVGVPSLAEDALASYRISLSRSGEGPDTSWLAEVEGLPSCSRRAATPDEAAQQAWAAVEELTAPARKAGRPAPEPKTAARHSGKLLVRMPATLHDELARAAEAEGVSLNQLITGALASAVEWRSGDEGPRRATSQPEQSISGRLTRAALAANLAVVALVAVVAIALLIVALR
jgi:predicted HicB family RNase H-like nuclease